MTRKQKILTVIFTLFFFVGIALGMIDSMVSMRDNQNYQVLQPELFAPTEIETVLYDETQGMLYVCYNDASYVNVYSEDGTFLWAVSTPYLQNAYFELWEDKLVVYDTAEAYLYQASNGAFIAKEAAGKLSLRYDGTTERTDDFEAGEIYFDTYQVYRAHEDGTLVTLVARPLWYWLFDFGVCWCISFCGGVGLGSLIFLRIRKERNTVQERASLSPGTATENRKARFVLRYFRICAIIHIVYAMLNVFLARLLNGMLLIGIVPITIHFIVSFIVFENMLERMALTEDEKKIMAYEKALAIGTFIIAFLSVIAATMLV